jgi:hypothetical protein
MYDLLLFDFLQMARKSKFSERYEPAGRLPASEQVLKPGSGRGRSGSVAGSERECLIITWFLTS